MSSLKNKNLMKILQAKKDLEGSRPELVEPSGGCRTSLAVLWGENGSDCFACFILCFMLFLRGRLISL